MAHERPGVSGLGRAQRTPIKPPALPDLTATSGSAPSPTPWMAWAWTCSSRSHVPLPSRRARRPAPAQRLRRQSARDRLGGDVTGNGVGKLVFSHRRGRAGPDPRARRQGWSATSGRAAA